MIPDLYLFNLINHLSGKWPVLDSLAIFFANNFGYILIVFLFAVFRRQWKVIIQAFSSAILSRLVITNIIRWIFPRLRPFVAEKIIPLISQSPIEPSFPSGHAAFYFAIAAVVYFYNKKAGILFFVGAFLISLARVFVGVHWPSDILAGAIVGIFSGWLVNKIFFKQKASL